MAFKIEYTARADADVDELLLWLIGREAGNAGLRWLNGLTKAIDRLRIMPESSLRYRKDRRLPYTVFQLFYGRKPHIFRVLFRLRKIRFTSFAFAGAE
jgi:plasmid stabilization system protein ParE